MAINVPAHDVTGKKEEGWVWATNKENARRAALDPPLAPLTPKNYLAEIEASSGKNYYQQKINEMAAAAAQAVFDANPPDP